MIRRATLVVLALAANAHADSDESVSAAVGFAGGGSWTPGGLHLDAAYLLRLDDSDQLDIGIGATKGGSTAACYADRAGGYTCDHGLAQGESVGFQAGVRHYLNDRYFLRGGIGVAVVRFPDDVVITQTDSAAMPAPTTGMNGIAITVHGGGGARVPITPTTAFIGAAELVAGASGFAGTADAQHQLGFAITAGIELVP